MTEPGYDPSTDVDVPTEEPTPDSFTELDLSPEDPDTVSTSGENPAVSDLPQNPDRYDAPVVNSPPVPANPTPGALSDVPQAPVQPQTKTPVTDDYSDTV